MKAIMLPAKEPTVVKQLRRGSSVDLSKLNKNQVEIAPIVNMGKKQESYDAPQIKLLAKSTEDLPTVGRKSSLDDYFEKV